MDVNYNVDEAKEHVDKLVKSRASESVRSMAGDQNFDYEIIKSGIPSCIRVVTTHVDRDGTPNLQEVLFRLQGVVTDVNLGPVKTMPSRKQFNKDLIHSVDISGLGSDAFQQSILNLFLWDVRMSRQFEADAWKAWTPVEGKDYSTVQFTNRIVTPAFLCEGAEPVPIPSDLGKHLKAVVDDGTHRYIQDNEIGLYQHIQSGKINKYVKASYTAFRVGDVVEVSFGLIAVPTSSGKRCMKLILRGLSLESSAFTTAMAIKKAMMTTESKKRKRTDTTDEGKKVNFTRARCYEEDEEEDLEAQVQEADGQMNKMDLERDDQSED